MWFYKIMGDTIYFKGEALANIHSYSGDNVTQFNIVIDGFDKLEKLCKLSNEEILEIEGLSPMAYGEFKQIFEHRIKRIYLSSKEYNADFLYPHRKQ